MVVWSGKREKVRIGAKIMPNIYKMLACLLAGFAGGSLAPWTWQWFKSSTVSSADAVSIANTYIVFTTLIFVGFTIILAVAGYAFALHFSKTYEIQQRQTTEALKEKLKQDDKLACSLAEDIFNNSAVQVYLLNFLDSKVQQLINEKVANANQQAVATQALAVQLNRGGQP